MTVTVVKCDSCRTPEPRYRDISLEVIYTIEQEEGHTVDPYLAPESLDLCEACMDKITQGNYLFCDSLQVYHFKSDVHLVPKRKEKDHDRIC